MPTPHDAFIIDAVRTPVGRGHPEKGMYRDLHPVDLLGRVYAAVVDRAGIDPAQVDTVITGCVYQIAQQGQGIARNAWLAQGLAMQTGATTLDIRCGSGQQAVHFAALRVSGGIDDVTIAAGVEHMGRVGFPVNEAAQREWGSGFTPELRSHYALVRLPPTGPSGDRRGRIRAGDPSDRGWAASAIPRTRASARARASTPWARCVPRFARPAAGSPPATR